MTESNVDYLRRRATEESQRSKNSDDPTAAAIHARLAILYADRIAALSENPDFDPLVQTRLID